MADSMAEQTTEGILDQRAWDSRGKLAPSGGGKERSSRLFPAVNSDFVGPSRGEKHGVPRRGSGMRSVAVRDDQKPRRDAWNTNRAAFTYARGIKLRFHRKDEGESDEGRREKRKKEKGKEKGKAHGRAACFCCEAGSVNGFICERRVRERRSIYRRVLRGPMVKA